jgi:hypothetical protein
LPSVRKINYVGSLAPMPGAFPDYPAPAVRNIDEIASFTCTITSSKTCRFSLPIARTVKTHSGAWFARTGKQVDEPKGRCSHTGSG